MRTILILVMALGLAAPAATQAGWTQKLNRSERAAAIHFAANPACVQITTVRRYLPFGDDGEAWSPCTIALDLDWLGELRETKALRAMKFRYLCRLWIHEYGHLLGFGHSPDPSDVMAETVTVTPRACFSV